MLRPLEAQLEISRPHPIFLQPYTRYMFRRQSETVPAGSFPCQGKETDS